MKPLGLILFSVALGVIGQICFKLGVRQAGKVELSLALLRLLFTPYIMAGILAYVISTLSWLSVLSKADLSFAYPMISFGYIIIVLVSLLLFKENVSSVRWLGVILISLGVFLTGRS